MKKLFTVLFFIVLASAGLNTNAQDTTQVIAVVDGDTVDVLASNQRVRLRLLDIDAPESKQAYGQKSRNFLKNLIYNQWVMVRPLKQDQYGRVLATIFLRGQNVNELMVRNGYAWAYRYNNQASNNQMLLYENEAMAAKRGLWIDPNPTEPWIFRQSKK